MMAERKESSYDEGRKHQIWISPVDLRHRHGSLSMGGSRYVVGDSSVYKDASRVDSVRSTI